jgi:hypothetical protein
VVPGASRRRPLVLRAVTVSTPPFAVMFALLHRLLPSPHRDVFLIGAVTFVATYAVQAWTWGGLALHADRLEPATARTVLDVAVFWGPVLTGATTTIIAPVTLLALRGHAGLPRWLGMLGTVVFVEQAIETITIFGSSGFTEPGGAMNLQLGAGLTATWMLPFAAWGGIRGRAVAQTVAWVRVPPQQPIALIAEPVAPGCAQANSSVASR